MTTTEITEAVAKACPSLVHRGAFSNLWYLKDSQEFLPTESIDHIRSAVLAQSEEVQERFNNELRQRAFDSSCRERNVSIAMLSALDWCECLLRARGEWKE